MKPVPKRNKNMKKLSLILLSLIALTQTAWAQDVNYIECSWTGSNTGGHVVQTTRTLADGSYTTLANNGDDYPSLSGGWYVVASNCSYFSRIVINGNVNRPDANNRPDAPNNGNRPANPNMNRPTTPNRPAGGPGGGMGPGGGRPMGGRR